MNVSPPPGSKLLKAGILLVLSTVPGPQNAFNKCVWNEQTNEQRNTRMKEGLQYLCTWLRERYQKSGHWTHHRDLCQRSTYVMGCLGLFPGTLGVLAGPRWGQEGNVSDSFLLWEQRAGGAEGRGRGESQTISALIRAPSASVSLGVCSLVCVREFGMTPSLWNN